MSKVIETLERSQLRGGIPRFKAGDSVRVHFQVVEGTRRRTQVFEGIVLKRQGSRARETFTVRKQSFGVGVERTFPLHSPKIERLEVAARGDVRRAKLYYLRGRVGKRARVSERRGRVLNPGIAKPSTARGGLIELVVIVALALGLALGIQAFLIKPYQIPSGSMEPTLHIGQRVLVNRFIYHFTKPKIGDIVVFHPPLGAERGNECGVPRAPSEPCPKPTPQEDSQNFIK